MNLANEALPLLSEKTRSLICYTGIGPEKAIQNSWGLGSVENYANPEDFVPIIGNITNPLRLGDLSQMFNGQSLMNTGRPLGSAGHGFDDYAPFLRQLPDNCQPKPVR